jgi:hypothetical protein
VKIDPDTHISVNSVLVLKLGVTEVVIMAVLTIGRKPRVDLMFLTTYSLQNYFPKSLSFILVFLSFMLFKLLSYSLLFPNIRWFVLAAQPIRVLHASPLVRWHQGMCHLRRRILLRSCGDGTCGRRHARNSTVATK